MNDLMVGVNYHPHDWDEERWHIDIDLMKKAHFSIVRMGHLCWDSYQPKEDCYTFEWFDRVLDLFHKAGIKVLLDIPTRPAPIWLHKKFPNIDIHDKNGIRQNAVFRYMEDVGDKDFIEYALTFASKFVEHYAKHPALMSFGLDNEVGAGYISYSEAAQDRFVSWLQKKYGTAENLNRAWAGQRWSRRINSFDEVTLPVSGLTDGAPERMLDMRRFYSEECGKFMIMLQKTVKEINPNIPTCSNHWAENTSVGFDYHKYYRDFVDFPSVGFYPGINPEDRKSVVGACMVNDHRIGEQDNPIWALEFQTGTFGGFACPKKVMRMYAYLSLLHRNQIVCGWTWRTMYGGDEQYLFGLLDHSGTSGRNYEEFKQIAMEFEKINTLDIFPRKISPEIGLAYSFESQLVTDYAKHYYKTSSLDQLKEAYFSLFDKNLDLNVVDIRSLTKNYKLLILPGITLMDTASEESIRRFVENGGTVLMSAYSAKVDETNKVFTSNMPGRLDDVFGITVAGFDRAVTHVSEFNEGGVEKEKISIRRKNIGISHKEKIICDDIDYYEFLKLGTATEVCSLTGTEENLPALTVNCYGKGKAYYSAVATDQQFFGYVIDMLCSDLDISRLEGIPHGVAACEIAAGVMLYVNTLNCPADIKISSSAESLLQNKKYNSNIRLEGYEVDLVRML